MGADDAELRGGACGLHSAIRRCDDGWKDDRETPSRQGEEMQRGGLRISERAGGAEESDTHSIRRCLLRHTLASFTPSSLPPSSSAHE